MLVKIKDIQVRVIYLKEDKKMKSKLNSTDQITSNQIKAEINCRKNELNLILI